LKPSHHTFTNVSFTKAELLHGTSLKKKEVLHKTPLGGVVKELKKRDILFIAQIWGRKKRGRLCCVGARG
jgi:hypothetical protein